MFLGPLFPTPFTDLFAFMSPNYRLLLQDDICKTITMRFNTCLEAYGSEKAKEKCRELFYDVYECHNNYIQNRRVREIREERKRKYKAGKIDELYSEKPPMESYFHV